MNENIESAWFDEHTPTIPAPPFWMSTEELMMEFGDKLPPDPMVPSFCGEDNG